MQGVVTKEGLIKTKPEPNIPKPKQQQRRWPFCRRSSVRVEGKSAHPMWSDFFL
jgi:hypothetical protein